MALKLRLHDQPLTLCKLEPAAPAPANILAQPFTYFFRTHDEATLICPTPLAPKNAVKAESGFIALQVIGPFALNEIGILTQIANPLAAAGVSIVPLSSFDTDYILVKADQRAIAVAALTKAGHSFID